MYIVVLAGHYPTGTYEKLRDMLPSDVFTVKAVDTIAEYDKMTDAEIMILRIFKAPSEVIQRNPSLKMIMRWGAGYDSVDCKTAGEQGVLVTNTPGANANAVSELAVMLMLAVGRKLFSHTERLQAGEWSKDVFLSSSFSLHNKLVGLIGGGNIGRQVAQKVQAFGAKVQYYDMKRLPLEQEAAMNMTFVSKEELLQTSDIVSLHLPLTEQTRHYIGEKELMAMKRGAMIINTSRGGLIDDNVLIASIVSGHLSGAGLDGLEQEPPPKDSALVTNPNIVVTPHIGGVVADVGDIILPMLVEDILQFAGGHTPEHIVNSEYINNK